MTRIRGVRSSITPVRRDLNGLRRAPRSPRPPAVPRPRPLRGPVALPWLLPRPLPRPRRLAADVWEAIAAREATEAQPLNVAPTYWARVVEASGGETPTIASVYAEARALLLPGIRASSTLTRAGTVGLWEDVVTNIFRGSTTSHALPPEWEGGRHGPCLRGTALRIHEPRGERGAPPPPVELCHQPTPNWLSTNSTMHLRLLFTTLAPPTHRLRSGRCPFCAAEESCTWEHVLRDCDAFWPSLPEELRPW